ncbi:tyrosine-type recombinase/integrase [Burkholderia vietnamiensis]|uniref:Phage integrase family protein n=1 Tax=Burkholderia vietnamiensis (strain G4 / LMG 22486) TaxID=269482 RepID=A4JFW6_BURVG|nr:phage integrase family protein [Burkholderia vietnamiensis G4]MCB4344923.1 tyrosine-type recombinase/integrase [Burkholderia vietnamiensis]
MKMPLTQDFVIEKLNINERPSYSPNGKIVMEPNEGRKPYIVFDSDQKAPVGFGVKVGATKKTYIVQRRVSVSSELRKNSAEAPPEVLKTTVGDVRNFKSIAEARDKARSMAAIMESTKRNPREIEREKDAGQMSLGEAFSLYREALVKRPKPATANTLDTLDKAIAKFKDWAKTRIVDLRPEAILHRFDEIAVKTRTSAEQTFRWASAAINHAIEWERAMAQSANRPALLTYNPFTILGVQKRYRSRAQLEAEYKKKGVRNPLSPRDTLGRFFDALLGRRDENRTGCDYLIVTTLWGTRKSEAAALIWRDLLTEEESHVLPWVCLETRRVFFPDTKNRSQHELPIADGVFKLLRMRRDLQLLEEFETPAMPNKRLNPRRRYFVFPARSKFSKTGHYSDAKSLLGYICQDAEIKRLTMHDLRRTLGRVAEERTSYAAVKRLLNHRVNTDPTTRYTEVEWERLKEIEQEIEAFMLATSPKLYNLLLAGGPRAPMLEEAESSAAQRASAIAAAGAQSAFAQ